MANETGTVVVTASGRVTPYTFTSNSTTNLNGTFTGIGAGTAYSWNLIDARGCTKSATLAIGLPTALSINGTVVNELCHGSSNDSVCVAVSGIAPGYTYHRPESPSYPRAAALPLTADCSFHWPWWPVLARENYLKENLAVSAH